MKQIITVLAILISGIASAQQLYTVSRCGGNAVPRYISINNQDYVLVGNYVDVVNAASGLVCLSNLNNVNRNWDDYYIYYLGASIVDNSSHNHWIITFTDYPNVEMERRTSGQYRVYRQNNGNRIIGGRNFFGDRAFRTAYEFAFNGNPPN